MHGEGMHRLAWLVGAHSRRRAVMSALGGLTLAATGFLAPTAGTRARKRKRCKKCRGRAQGETCTTNKDCCANDTRRSCALPNSASTVAVCCGANGAACGDSGECCLGLACSASGQCEVQI